MRDPKIIKDILYSLIVYILPTVLLTVLGILIGGIPGGIITLGLSLIINVVIHSRSDALALSAVGAQPINPGYAPQLLEFTQQLANQLDVPVPKVCIVPSQQANALTVGRGLHSIHIAVTSGLLSQLTPDEIKAVIAHELGHVRNRDVMAMTAAAVIASGITKLSRLGKSKAYHEPSLFIVIISPLIVSLLSFASAFSRELDADEVSASLLGTGKPLAEALRKIHISTQQTPLSIDPAFTGLFIDNPFGAKPIGQLFSTHPSYEDRIKRLSGMFEPLPFATMSGFPGAS